MEAGFASPVADSAATELGDMIDLAQARSEREMARFSKEAWRSLGRQRGNWSDDWDRDRPRPRTGAGSGALAAKRRTQPEPSLPDGSPIRHDWPYGPPRELAGPVVREACAKIDCEYANSDWPAALENAEWHGHLTRPRDSASEIFRRYGLLEAIRSEGAMAIARLAGMGERQAQVWVASVERGMSVREIWRALGVSHVAVVKHLISARARAYEFAQRLEARDLFVAA